MKQLAFFLAIGLIGYLFLENNARSTTDLKAQIVSLQSDKGDLQRQLQQLKQERDRAKEEIDQSRQAIEQIKNEIARISAATAAASAAATTTPPPQQENKSWLQKRIDEQKPKLDEPAKKYPSMFPRYWVDQFGYRHYYYY